LISKSGIHALRAITVLAQLEPGKYQHAAAIAKATGSPANYLSKILHQMSRDGVLESQKGQGGGFRMSRSPETMSVYDIVEAIDDLRAWNRCMFGNAECSDDRPCGLHDKWLPVRQAFLSMLKTTSITELVAGSNPAINTWIESRPDN
jgi:Rrf2 family iron-sulfur cluster assembly transcriptional regulator